MLKQCSTIVMTLLTGMALAQEPTGAIGDETTTADQGKDKVESTTVAAVAAKPSGEIELPAGFKKRKRGDLVLYCIKGKATGTRFPTESCYDEAGLADYLLKREASNREFEQRRAICANPAICAPQ